MRGKALHECMITLCVLAHKTGKQLLRVLIKFSVFEEEMAKMLTVSDPAPYTLAVFVGPTTTHTHTHPYTVVVINVASNGLFIHHCTLYVDEP